LTDTGREYVAAEVEKGTDPFASFDEATVGPDLRMLVMQLADATRQVGRSGTDAQREAGAKILADARRAMYLLLADGPEAADA
jgi:hypothetical protein